MRAGKLFKENQTETQLLGKEAGLKCTICTRHPSLISILHLENSYLMKVWDRDTSLLCFIYTPKGGGELRMCQN